MCPIGFIFWTSPIYSGERFAGALMSSGILAVKRQEAAENIFRNCKGAIPREEIAQYLTDIPEKTADEVKALAQMMLICVEQLSGGTSSPVPLAVKGSGGNPYPIDKERKLLANLRRGDTEEARKILKELLNTLFSSYGGSFELFQLRALELVVLLSRAAVNPENPEAPVNLEAKM
jgi:hypothetical protein